MSNRKTDNRQSGPRMGGTRMSMDKPKNFKSTMKKLVSYLKPYYALIITVIIFAIGSTVFTIIGPKVLGQATTILVEGIMAKVQQTGEIEFDRIAYILLIMAGLYLVSAIFSYAQNYFMADISQKVSYDLRKEASLKINKLPLKYFDSITHGEVLSRVTNDIDTLSSSLSQSLTQMISATTALIGILIMMFSISWQMTLLTLFILPITAISISFIIKRSQKYFAKQQEYLGNVNGHIEEMYSGHTIVKAFNGEKQSVESFKKHNDSLYNSAWKSQFLSGLMHPITSFIGNLGYVGVCLLGGYYAINGKLSIGEIQAFIQYVKNFTQPITQTAQIANVLQSTAAASERIFEFLNEQEQMPEIDNPVKVIDNNGNSIIEGNVTFENVRFGYNEDKIIINDFSMHVRKGQKIAIVGPTGAGKSTIMKLLMRFYELNSGSIYVDGHNIKDFTRYDLRDMFGMVLQEAWLFNGNIMENIRYGRVDATDEEVIKASDMAYVDHFIRTLEHGYQTEINEESTNISQGQKQLLTIARAFLSDPKILILDEATSSVDTRTEVLIQKGMNNLMKGRTSFIIAHRLSTIRDADCIIVMDKGDIVEIGSHEYLLEQKGFYHQLYNSQFEQVEE